MGLFDAFKKKDCEICGKEVGIFGYKKLEDGEICKDCVRLLSPWFDDRRHFTVEQIKAQISYREDNRKQLESFRPTISIGNYYEIKVEVVNGVPTRFVITRDNYLEENADLISFSQVSSFSIDIREDKDELKQRDNNGNMISYNPPRYEYSYDFYCDLMVNSPYFDDIRVRINSDTLNLETVQGNRSGFGQFLINNNFDPTLYPEYREYKAMCDQLQDIFNAGMQNRALAGHAQPAAQDPLAALFAKIPTATKEEISPLIQELSALTKNRPDSEALQEKGMKAINDRTRELYPVSADGQAEAAAPAGPKFCPNCGAPTEGGKFCQSCGTKF